MAATIPRIVRASSHAGLVDLQWTASGHSGTASHIAGFNGGGAASEYSLSGTGTELALTNAPTFVDPVLGNASATTMTLTGDWIVPKTSGVGIKIDTAAPDFGWRDIIGSIAPKATGTGAPARATYRGNISDYAFVANDLVDFVFHIPHDYAPGTDIYFHVHWSHNGTTVSGNAVFDLYFTYAKGHNQEAFPAEKNLTITYNTVDIATTPQYQHRIDETVMSAETATGTLMDRDDIEVDGLIIATLKLTTLPTIGGGGKLFIHTCDIHYQSTNLATKQKAPDFWT